MLKQSYRSNYQCYTTVPTRPNHGKHSSRLYDRARQDLFDTTHDHHTTTVPSITTICLLQIQANIIQVLAYLPHHDKAVLKQCLRWILLITLLLLDNLARILNVDQEMKDLKKKKQNRHHPETNEEHRLDDGDVYYHGQCTTQSLTSQQPLSERTSPMLVKRTQQQLVTPIAFFPKSTRKAYTQPSSPTTPTRESAEERKAEGGSRSSRANRVPSHGRSLSNTMIDKDMSPQKLRRVTGQREITVQNAILPIMPRPSVSSTTSRHDRKVMVNSSGLSESSESSATLSAPDQRPKMQKTVSLSTAQQYHKQVEVNIS
ncbi:hypothetical protein A0J61_08276 [Choanephora cucurbitarum]|uniref:Uncharacterized protein n=1 Tax=Choanephora cucurbitarum TaxID=101091 RepID=A0A1C7N8J6_9FUNG|nr:hypothetical protein A0J61_08276 [Choanephora cucurbitarum]